MFRCRMASRPFSFVPSWLIFCVTAVLAATNVPNEFSSFIPSCAAECFASFLNVNYVLDTCTGRHLLDCLCPRIGALGFTLGEGAMQCISAERSIGLCSTVEASGMSSLSLRNLQESLTQTQNESLSARMLSVMGGRMQLTQRISPSQQHWLWILQEEESSLSLLWLNRVLQQAWKLRPLPSHCPQHW